MVHIHAKQYRKLTNFYFILTPIFQFIYTYDNAILYSRLFLIRLLAQYTMVFKRFFSIPLLKSSLQAGII